MCSRQLVIYFNGPHYDVFNSQLVVPGGAWWCLVVPGFGMSPTCCHFYLEIRVICDRNSDV